jgi:hypothetical protein
MAAAQALRLTQAVGCDFGRLAETSPAAWQRYCGSLTPLFVGR